MSEMRERLRDYRSRVSFDEKTIQLVAGTIVLIVGLIGVSLSSTSSSTTTRDVAGAGPTASAGSPSAPGISTAVPGSKSSGSVGVPGGPGTGTLPGGGGVSVPNFGSNARGVTDKEILIGAAYDKNAGAVNTAFGFGGIGQIDQKRALETVRDYINARGGIGGRKIRFAYHELDELSGKSIDQNAQEACTTWTQQYHVYAALAGSNDTLNACLKKAGVVQLGAGVASGDAKLYAAYPLLVFLGGPGYDAISTLSVDHLVSQGFYAKGRSDQPKLPFKLGVLAYDQPVDDRALVTYHKALDRHHIKLSETQRIVEYQSEAEIASTVAAVRSAVIKFKADRITHVQFLANGPGLGFMELIFWQQADQQRYYPRYGLTSQNAAQAIIPTLDQANGNGTAARTLVDAVGVGWFPLFDVPRSDYTGAKESSALRLCKKLLSYETFDDASRNKEALAAIVCDSLFYLDAAVERAGRIVNQKSWLYGVANVGKLPSAETFDMGTSATRHAGMNAVRDLRFFKDCTCFHYTSGDVPA